MKNLSHHIDLLCVGNLIADEGDPDRRIIKTGLADWTG
jgi:hypothetical protein